MDASQYTIDPVLKQREHQIAWDFETLSQAKLYYSSYNKEFYAPVHPLNQWQDYILDKETICHTDHQPLQFLNSQSKIQV